MPLTDIAVRTAKARDKAYRLTDGGNMYLFVNTRGGRYWRMDYRFDGRRDMLAFGVYPDVSLADARAARSEAQRLLKQGIDPKAQRKLDKLVASVAAANTFKELGEEWQAKRKREGKAEATLTKDRWLLNDYAYPWIGQRPIGDIEAPELLAVLKRAEDKGVLETARRLRSLCGRIFRYGIATGRAKRDPSADLRDALTTPKVTHRAALLTPKAVGGLIRSIRGFEGQAITKAALQISGFRPRS